METMSKELKKKKPKRMIAYQIGNINKETDITKGKKI